MIDQGNVIDPCSSSDQGSTKRAVVFANANVGDRGLRVLHAAGVEIALVVTHSDRPDDARWLSRVADTACELGLPWLICDDPHAPELAQRLGRLEPDLIFSFYYAAMIPAPVLALARDGAFNLHGSLLPQFRGRAPTNWAVLMGATETGATLHWMVKAADAGDIVDQQAVPILPDDTGKQVLDKVTVAAEQVLWRSLPALLRGEAARRPNPIDQGSYYSRRRPEDGRIDWQRPAVEVYNLIRAVAPPYPGAFVDLGPWRLVVARARRRSGLTIPQPTSTAPERSQSQSQRLGLAVLDGIMVGRCGDGGLIDIQSLLLDQASVSGATLQTLLDACDSGRSEH